MGSLCQFELDGAINSQQDGVCHLGCGWGHVMPEQGHVNTSLVNRERTTSRHWLWSTKSWELSTLNSSSHEQFIIWWSSL